MKNQKMSIVAGLAWSFAERIAAQMVSTVVGIILARLLMPEDYGLISIVMVFISFCNVLVTAGFGTAVIQKKEADDMDFDTAFILSLVLSILLYTVLYFAAPYIAKIYNIPQLSNVLRVLGIRLIINSWNTIQQSYIRRQMQFRRFFVATIWGTLLSCAVGVAMAFSGYGVWALVTQYLVNSGVGTIVLHFVGGWKPRFRFSATKAREIYSFGWRILCAQLIPTIGNDLRSLIVGKYFGAADLAYFDQAKKYPALLIDNVNSSINKVMLPAFSKKQNDLCALKMMLRKSIRLGMFIMAPLMIGLYSVSDTFVSVVLTEKWLPTVPYLKIFCIFYLTRPLEELCNQTVISLGRSDITMKIMTAINVVSVTMVLLSVIVFESVYCMALFILLNTLVSVVCFSFATNRLVEYHVKEQLSDTMPAICLALIMGLAVSALKIIQIHSIMLLLIQVIIGAIVYVALSFLFKLESVIYIWNTVFVNKLNRRKK